MDASDAPSFFVTAGEVVGSSMVLEVSSTTDGVVLVILVELLGTPSSFVIDVAVPFVEVIASSEKLTVVAGVTTDILLAVVFMIYGSGSFVVVSLPAIATVTSFVVVCSLVSSPVASLEFVLERKVLCDLPVVSSLSVGSLSICLFVVGSTRLLRSTDTVFSLAFSKTAGSVAIFLAMSLVVGRTIPASLSGQA